jgi:hypothetical protein
MIIAMMVTMAGTACLAERLSQVMQKCLQIR